MKTRTKITATLSTAIALAVLSCVAQGPGDVPVHGWWDGLGPVMPHETFPADCSLCHVGDDWSELRDDFQFDHEAQTGVPLVGSHGRAQCLRCHNDRGPVAVFAARGCSGCHEDLHLGQLGNNCGDCHDEIDWRPRGQIEQHSRTRFPLVGAHAAASCRRCHPGAPVGQFMPTDTECVSCHQDDLERATSPDHFASGWVSDCDRCHIPTTWTGQGFNHATWPLTGKHRTLSCSECHVGGVFTGTSRHCFDCHEPDYLSARDPDHVALGIPHGCRLCHDTTSWTGARFDHSWVVDSCVTCHLDDYLATTNPDHQAAGYSTECQQCHNTKTWFGADFDHDFPLKGPHNKNCTECHQVPNDYSIFSCTHCHDHNKREMDDKHDDVSGYTWESNACYNCHPNGKE